MTLQVLPTDSVSEYLTAADAADILGLSKVHVLRLAHNGTLPADRPFGDATTAPYRFLRVDVERLAAIRRGDIGDVLDRVDLRAAGGEPTEERDAYIRAAWLDAIDIVATRNGGEFSTGRLRPHLPDDAKGPSSGGLITGLVRSHRIEHTGAFDTLSDPRARHASTPCKVYRVIGDLA